ncbi:MAG: ornithine cyclodeaminase family protein [Saprospiraceae bacterium]|nr:ornithine cyclodeaminase family protein [Saprospiraceae bacterium]
MDQIVHINAQFIQEETNFLELIDELKSYFINDKILSPLRHHHEFLNLNSHSKTSLLLMPAWNPGINAGIKMVTVNPENSEKGIDSIQGVYIYLDAETGVVKAILDAKSLTAKRTAAASALASTYLSNPKSNALLMIGTGVLAPNLISAHASVRPIKTVYVWGRNLNKAQKIADMFISDDIIVTAVDSIAEVLPKVDIISSATLSPTPLIKGAYLRKGQHVDLVGSYQPHTREADDETIQKASVFVDTYQGGLKESGDIVIPLKNGIINRTDIKADLNELCSDKKKGRVSDQEITVFKSVGHAIEDLAAANYYHRKFINE